MQGASDNISAHGTVADIHSVAIASHVDILRMSCKIKWIWMDCGNRAGVVRGCLFRESTGMVAVYLFKSTLTHNRFSWQLL